MDKKYILFVCDGNTCRSVMAQALFQKIKKDFFPELGYHANSAGISADEGAPPSRETSLCLAKQRIDVATYKSKLINKQLLENSYLILTMTDQQQDYLKENFCWAQKKIYLFKPFSHQKKYMENGEINDPYGMGLSYYENICKYLEQDIEKLILYLREDSKNE